MRALAENSIVIIHIFLYIRPAADNFALAAFAALFFSFVLFHCNSPIYKKVLFITVIVKVKSPLS